MNNYQDYFFEKESDVLFVNEETQRVGVLNSDPQYTVDVNGSINTSNLLGVNALLSNLQSDYIVADTVIAGSNLTEFIQADVGVIDVIQSKNIFNSNNIITSSNLGLLNTYLNQECPVINNGTLFGFSLGGGFISSSWIKPDNDLEELLNSLWNAGQTGWDLFNLAKSIYDDNDDLAEELKDAIGDALSNGRLKTPWGSVKDKPIYAGELTKNLGVAGHLYLSKSKIIYAVDEANFSTANPNNNLDLTTSAGRREIINLSNQNAYFKDISCSNIAITSNLQVPSINANEIITGSVKSVDLVRCGEFYLTPSGLYLGNPANPLSSVLVIDNQGNYKGTIDKGQIIDLEAWNFKAMADGNLVFGSFGETNILNDPFSVLNGNPLFSVS